MALRCLIVDDNPEFLAAACDLLERQGLVVVGVASTSDQALALARELRPDVMLVDVELGDETGFDVALRLARETDLDDLPVVLVSAYGETDLVELIAASPVVGFLPKAVLSAPALCAVLSRE